MVPALTKMRWPRVRDPATPSHRDDPMAPSPYWGDKPIWDSRTSNHNPMMDERGRVWFTARIRPFDNPDYCKKGSEHPSARVFPLARSTRHLSMYDANSGRFTLISTCFPTHHLVFAEDANQTLWTSSGGAGNQVLGWLDRKRFDETGDEARAQGWTPLVVDANGNGKRDAWVEPKEPLDPKRDKRLAIGLYAVAVNPQDGSVWGTALGFPAMSCASRPGPIRRTPRSPRSSSRRCPVWIVTSRATPFTIFHTLSDPANSRIAVRGSTIASDCGSRTTSASANSPARSAPSVLSTSASNHSERVASSSAGLMRVTFA